MDTNIGEIIKSTRDKDLLLFKMLRNEKFMNPKIVQCDGTVLSELAPQNFTHLQKILYK
jgi:hypothetical protein